VNRDRMKEPSAGRFAPAASEKRSTSVISFFPSLKEQGMQKRSGQKFMAQAGGAFVLFAVPAMALAWFSPSAWSALAVGAPQNQQVAVAPSAAATTVLNQWSDTATPQLDVLDMAHMESASLNNTLRSLRTLINGLNKSAPNYNFQFQFTQQSLLTIFNEEQAFDSTYRMIAVPGANQNDVQQTLNGLNAAFLDANTKLITLHAQEIQSGSIMTFTAPTF
jgi:hypothetical protein